jgi:hypothetical protein
MAFFNSYARSRPWPFAIGTETADVQKSQFAVAQGCLKSPSFLDTCIPNQVMHRHYFNIIVECGANF